jgi:hypothetical protein
MLDAHIQLVNIKGCNGAAGFKPPKGSEHQAWNLTGPKMKMGQDAYLLQQSKDCAFITYSFMYL